MARKKRKKNSKKRKTLKTAEDVSTTLDRETWLGIGAILLFALGIILFLSIFNLAGQMGVWVNDFLVVLLGWLFFSLPLILFLVAFSLLKSREHEVRFSYYLGALLLLLSISAIAHLFIPQEELIEAVKEGRGGGYLGMILNHPVRPLLGFIGSLVFFVTLFLISLMILFNKSLRVLWDESFISRVIERFHGDEEDKETDEESERVKETEDEEDEGEEQEDKLKRNGEKKKKRKLFQIHQIKEPEMNAEKEVILEEPKIKFTKQKIDLPVKLLSNGVGKPSSGNIKKNTEIIRRTLEHFNIPVQMGEVKVGPAVTQYTLKPYEGIKLNKIRVLNDDLALALAAHPIRIEAPIPGQSLVGIEVPNCGTAVVKLKDIIDTKEFINRNSNLAVALGKDVSGRPWLADLDKMPHLLVAGATGAGKSVCLNSVILSLLYQNTPEFLRFIMVDPKRVELSIYNDIPHLLTPVITDVKKTINSLRWLITEMDRRYELLAKLKKRNIQSYNLVAEEKIPYIIVIVDELADLMAARASEVEAAIIRLAQMSRAVGIHLILATQRPSVDVITGLIKANIPARIAFNVTSIVDSRTILDIAGAEKLIGKGDMLFLSPDISKPVRLQGSYVDDEEIKRVVDFLKNQVGEPEFCEEVVEGQARVPVFTGVGMDENGDDLFEEAKETVIQADRASTSFLQRKLRIGYARAARLMDLLEEHGVVGPQDGAKPRVILMKNEDFYEAEEAEDLDLEEETEEHFKEEGEGVEEGRSIDR